MCRKEIQTNTRYCGGIGGSFTAGGNRYMPFAEYVAVGKVQSNKIRLKLLNEGLKEAKCECCNNTQWNGVPIPLEVHHKDGDKNNNQLDNLQILCPNCHALTPTYRGKNIKK